MAVAPEIASAIFRQPSAVAPLVILSLYGVVRSATIGIGTAANGVGLARDATTSAWLNVMMMAVAVPVGFELAGPSGVAFAVLVSISVSSVVVSVQLARRTRASFGGLVAPLALTAVAGLAALLLQDRGSLPLRIGLAAIEIVVAGFLIQSHVQLDWGRLRRPEHSADA
jgi:hypothetical protein